VWPKESKVCVDRDTFLDQQPNDGLVALGNGRVERRRAVKAHGINVGALGKKKRGKISWPETRGYSQTWKVSNVELIVPSVHVGSRRENLWCAVTDPRVR
jgi:hypothetical protein